MTRKESEREMEMAEYEELKAALKAEIIEELRGSKREKCLWTQEKSKLRERVEREIRPTKMKPYQVVDALATFGKCALGKQSIVNITEADMIELRALLGELLDIVKKYQGRLLLR